MTWEPTVIQGHPTRELDTGQDQPTLITLCSHCGQMRTILFLTGDRWTCTQCKAEGATHPTVYPVA